MAPTYFTRRPDSSLRHEPTKRGERYFQIFSCFGSSKLIASQMIEYLAVGEVLVLRARPSEQGKKLLARSLLTE